MTAPEQKPNDRDIPDNSFAETFRTIIIAILIAMTIRTLAFEPFNIPSTSMVPTLLVGDYLFVSKYSYGYGSTGTFWDAAAFTGRIGGHAPERGDVVVFKKPPENHIDYIKRLIGLPGDEIQMRHGILYINGVPVDRDRLDQPVPTDSDDLGQLGTVDYLEHLPGGVEHIIRKRGDDNALDDTQVFTVPPHHYFFMGDNRDNSQDSRTKMVGYVPEENLVGKAQFIFLSLKPDSSFLKFWQWPWTIRWNRLFNGIH